MSDFKNASATFRGELNGISPKEFSEIDYDKILVEDRLNEIIKKIEYLEPFLSEYFFVKEKDKRDTGEFDSVLEENDYKTFFKYSPSLKEELSSDINICKYLENYATYILNSKDLPKSKQIEYRILSPEEFKKQLNKECAFECAIDSSVVMDLRPKNDYINIDLKILDSDFKPENKKYLCGLREKDLYLTVILTQYEEFKQHLKTHMNKIKQGEETYLKLHQIKSILGSVIKDMLDAKQMILGIRCKAKKLGDTTKVYNFDEIDYKNLNHVKNCLKYCALTKSPAPEDTMSHIGYDLFISIKRLTKSKKIDKIDKEIILCYNKGYSLREIANKVNRCKNTVQQRLIKIIKLISQDLG